MTLPAPNLDDRRFQDLVDDAKRLVMRRCPSWTDHNVSDPGVTLIEAFAQITDQLLFRLNRVPDRLYIKFLELIGIELFTPAAARTQLTFWLTTPATGPLTIPAGTRAATLRSEVEDPIVFTTTDDLQIVATSMDSIAVRGEHTEGAVIDNTGRVKVAGFEAFSPVPAVGDALLIGLTAAVPRNALALRFACTIEGVGVDPEFPPLHWQAWDGAQWVDCELERDTTGGLNRNGEVVLLVPDSHVAASIGGVQAAWIRAQVIKPDGEWPAYSSSPLIHSLEAMSVGGFVDSVNADFVEADIVGESTGVPGESFTIHHGPALSGGEARVQTSSDEGWVDWTLVDDFTTSTAEDRVVHIDYASGSVQFAPSLREADGTIRELGQIPERGAAVRVGSYWVGGGHRGNVPTGAIRTVKSSIPFISAVENRQPATGGVDGEDIENAKIRGPLSLRTRNRAITSEDFELLTQDAAPEIARVRCLPAENADEVGGVRILVVPAAGDQSGRLEFADLIPSEAVLERIRTRLDAARLVGTRLLIEPPSYQGATVIARLTAEPGADEERVRQQALERLYGFVNPLTGGRRGRGWEWGRPLQSGDAFAVLQGIDGVDVVEDIRIFGANPVTGDRGEATDRLEISPSSLVFSYEHQIVVETR